MSSNWEVPLQLIQFRNASQDNHYAYDGIDINRENLSSVLRRTNGHPLCIICVCGPSRQGKSFLLGYILRYLQALENDEFDWMEYQGKTAPLTGFKFRNGTAPETQGIWIWSKPFNIKCGLDGDKPLSIILMDTQGTHDEFTNSRTMASIVGLSMLMSSCMVFNCFKTLQEDVLTSLDSYISYGRLALQEQTSAQGSSAKPFQKLMFLIRDWNNPAEFPYGDNGGNDFLQKMLMLKEGQSPEAVSIRQTIQSCFESLDCCLLPYPGDKAIHPDFKGSVAELNPTFAVKLKEVINKLANPEGLTPKNVFGNEISALELESLLETYITIFNSADTPSPVSMLEATTYVVNKNILQKSFQKYVDILKRNQRTKKFLRGADLTKAHTLGKKEAKLIFSNSKKFGSDEKIQELEEELENLISKEYQNFQETNEKKWKAFIEQEIAEATDMYKEQMALEFLFNDDSPLEYYSESEVEVKGKNLMERTMDEFREKVGENQAKEISQLEDKLNEFQKSLELENQARKKSAESSLQNYIEKIISECEEQLKNKVSQDKWMDPAEIDQLRTQMETDILRKFTDVRKKHLPKEKSNSPTLPNAENVKAELLKLSTAISTAHTVQLQEAQVETDRVIGEVTGMYSERIQAASEDSDDVSSLEDFHRINLSEMEMIFEEKCPFPKFSLMFMTNFEKLRESCKAIFESGVHSVNHRLRESEEKVKRAIEESANLYHNEMLKSLKSAAFLSEDELKRCHEHSTILAMNHFEGFDRLRESIFKEGEDEKREALELKITADFSSFELQNVQNRELAESEATNLVTACQTEYGEVMKTSMETSKSEEEFKEHHAIALKEALDSFKSKCKSNDTQHLAGYLAKLENECEEIFKELLVIFGLTMGAQSTLMAGTIADAQIFYDDEMSKHFKNSEFIRPQELEKLHQKTAEICLNRCLAKAPLTQSEKAEVMDALQKPFQKYLELNDMNLECDDVAIGIDLGTTYSCVAAYVNGKVHVIPNTVGKKTTPSYVLYDEDGTKTVGETVKNRAYENPEETIFDAKRIIGRKIDDEKLQKDMKLWPFVVVDDSGVPKIRVRGEVLYPEQVSAEILKEMKSVAEGFLKREVKKAVITVPAYFTDGQRQATIDAGDLAGLKVLEILTEPVAAAIAYKKQHAEIFGGGGDQRCVLIFDLGGGTFDVAVLKSTYGQLDVLAIGGNDHLGGEDFDRTLMEHCAAEFRGSSGVNLFDGMDSTEKQTRDEVRRRLKRLQGECERKKIELASARRVEVSIDSFFRGKDLSVVITREKFEELNAHYFDETIKIVKSTLADAKIQKEQVQDIVLVGGSTRILKIQELLKTYFGGKALDISINPDEAVAWGAAMRAAFKNGSITKESIDFTKIQDVTPMSIGVEVYGGNFSVIIPKGTKIPVKAKESYRTAHNNQTSVQVTVFQGEQPIAVDNKHLGDFYLNGIPPKNAGKENIDVEMVMNSQGILHVNAVCSSTGGSQGITVTENKQRMSRALIKKLAPAPSC